MHLTLVDHRENTQWHTMVCFYNCRSKASEGYYINDFVQDCGNSSLLSMELPQSCTKP